MREYAKKKNQPSSKPCWCSGVSEDGSGGEGESLAAFLPFLHHGERLSLWVIYTDLM